MGNRKSGDAKVLSSKMVYRGPVFSVTTDYVVEPSGIQVRRDVVRHQGSVVVMAVDDTRSEPHVLLARQYRHAAGRFLWEIPAGRIDEGEAPLAGAKRELLEETGYRATEWKRVLFFFASPGFLDEWMALYLARGLRRGAARPEEDEVIRKRMFPISQAAGMVMRGVIQDAKTIAGILWLERTWREGLRGCGISARLGEGGSRARMLGAAPASSPVLPPDVTNLTISTQRRENNKNRSTGPISPKWSRQSDATRLSLGFS